MYVQVPMASPRKIKILCANNYDLFKSYVSYAEYGGGGEEACAGTNDIISHWLSQHQTERYGAHTSDVINSNKSSIVGKKCMVLRQIIGTLRN